MPMPDHNPTAPSPAADLSIPERTPCRLAYPPPPSIRVRLCSESTRLDLPWLGLYTGQADGEVAAVLLQEALFGDPAAKAFAGASQGLQELHAARRQELGLPAGSKRGHPYHFDADMGDSVSPLRVVLSRQQNERLYQLAVESGLSRDEVAEQLLASIDLQVVIRSVIGTRPPQSAGERFENSDEANRTDAPPPTSPGA
jgi:hypothetical protein